MTTITSNTRRKPQKPVVRVTNTTRQKSVNASSLLTQKKVAANSLTGQALLVDMEEYRKRVTASPKSARDFLTRLGVMTPSGKVKKLIRG